MSDSQICHGLIRELGHFLTDEELDFKLRAIIAATKPKKKKIVTRRNKKHQEKVK